MSTPGETNRAHLVTNGFETWVAASPVPGNLSTEIITTDIMVDRLAVAVTEYGHTIAYEAHDADGRNVVRTLGRGVIDKSTMRFTFNPAQLDANNGAPTVKVVDGGVMLKAGNVGGIASISLWVVADRFIGVAEVGKELKLSLNEQDGQLSLASSPRVRGKSLVTLRLGLLKGVRDTYHLGRVSIRGSSYVFELAPQTDQSYMVGRIAQIGDNGDAKEIKQEDFLKFTGFELKSHKAARKAA